MSRSRQPSSTATGPQLRTSSVTYASGYTWHDRKSAWGQLVYASRGAMTVHTDAGLWVVPPHQAMWVPAGVRHDVQMAGSVAMRMVYLQATLCRRLPRTCRAVDVSPLLRELLRRAIRLQTLDRREPTQSRLLGVLLDELAVLPLAPLDLRSPRDPRAVRAATFIRGTPESAATFEEIAQYAGASERTLARLFRVEMGLSLGAWRQRVRLLHALQLLAEGANVTAAAIAIGYDSTSAFVAAFRRVLGSTPGKYFRARPVDGEVEAGIGVLR